MTKQFTQEEREDVVKKFLEARAAGTKVKDIEKTLGIGNATIYGWINRKRGGSKKAAPQTDSTHKQENGKYPVEIRTEALQLVASGMRQHEVARKMKIGAAVLNYWVRQNRVKPSRPAAVPPTAKASNGMGSGGAITDALIFLRHAEEEIMEQIRQRKILHLNESHLLPLLALAQMEKAIRK